MEKTNPKAYSKRVLGDHKQLRKRFIPPFAQIPNLSEISWRKEIVPNYLWIALLNQLYGYAKAAEFCVDLAKIAIQVANNEGSVGWFSAISSYDLFSESQWDKIISLLEEKQIIDFYRQSFKELINYYPKCPFRYLYKKNQKFQDDEKWLRDFKDLLEKLINRTSQEATFVQADVLYIGFLTEKFAVAEKIVLAEFPEIEKYPDTDKSKLVASSIRATINMIGDFEIKAAKFDWAGYFWNRGLEIEKCEVFTDG